MDLGNTKDLCVDRSDEFRSVLSLGDREQGKFGMWSWQDCQGTIARVEKIKQIERKDGTVFMGSVPQVHYNELLRLKRLEKMDHETFYNLVMGYLNHSNFSKFRGKYRELNWTPWNWFYDMLDDKKALTAFYAQRKRSRLLAA